MRSLLPTIVVVWLVALAGCAGDRPPPVEAFNPDAHFEFDAGDNDLGIQTFDIIPIDVIVHDIPTVDAPAQPGMPCVDTTGCAFGLVCLQGYCAVNTCFTTDAVCGENARCNLRCVPTHDLCEGVVCANNETCYLGHCTAGCFPGTCTGVSCPAGQFCDDTTGACAPLHPCSAPCEKDFTCHVQCVPLSNCDGVQCAPNQICSDGVCVANPCAGVTCPSGSVCTNGVCNDTCLCDPPCTRSPRDHCIVGQCICTPTCTAASFCGDDDGCGGHCLGPCNDPTRPRATCDAMTGTCVCTPFCAASAGCGSNDGCGGHCNKGGCGDTGELTCNPVTNACECTPRCPPAEQYGDTPCGQVVPNICAGGPMCGTGNGCPSGQVCMGSSCSVADPTDASGTGGGGDGMCEEGRTMCMGGCYNLQTNPMHCGACDTVCPFGTTCTAGVCTCPGTLTLCNGRCVNTDSDQGNCGACNNACTGLTVCTAGACACVPNCPTSRASVACNQEIPNACAGAPSCGVGTLCPVGSYCDSALHRCACVPVCPAGVTCGTSNGCPAGSMEEGTCVGLCPTGQSCARDPLHPNRYACSAAACNGGCTTCGHHCDTATNTCVLNTCSNGTSPCPCDCCPIGQMCAGGNHCVLIPP